MHSELSYAGLSFAPKLRNGLAVSTFQARTNPPLSPDPSFSLWVRTFQTLSKKFFQKAHDLVVIYTPKEAHSRIFVTGVSVIA